LKKKADDGALVSQWSAGMPVLAIVNGILVDARKSAIFCDDLECAVVVDTKSAIFVSGS